MIKKHISLFSGYLGILFILTSCAHTQNQVSSAAIQSDTIRSNHEETTGKYLEQINQNRALLRQFFSAMPKGGDLHNHLTGSVYAETYFNFAAMDSLWVDTLNGKIFSKGALPDSSEKTHSIQLFPQSLTTQHNIKVKLIDWWSIRNFDSRNRDIPPDEYFFGAFGRFGAASENHMVELVSELKQRAILENVQYLEIMGTSPRVNEPLMNLIFGENAYHKYNHQLLEAIALHDSSRISTAIDLIIGEWENNPDWLQQGINYGRYMDSLDNNSLQDTALICRYLAYASRNSDPVKVLAQLHIGFMAASDSTNKVVGVNIVSAENSEISMAHYTAHMLMFARLKNHKKYQNVKTSLHAGELTLGLVLPEELRNHISQAVYIAGADRIGHGVDAAFENPDLLKTMQENKIPVEINLTSNEFILGVSGNEHPLPLYLKAGVPVVISTDDPGILRTNLTEQYVLLVERYNISYRQVKLIILSSIHFSFLKEEEKAVLMEKMDRKFIEFEKMIAEKFE